MSFLHMIHVTVTTTPIFTAERKPTNWLHYNVGAANIWLALCCHLLTIVTQPDPITQKYFSLKAV